MPLRPVALAALALSAGLVGPAQAADGVDAGRLCAPFDVSGLFTRPCAVDIEGQAVVLALDRPAAIAKALCPTWADMTGMGDELGEGWTLRLVSANQEDVLTECDI